MDSTERAALASPAIRAPSQATSIQDLRATHRLAPAESLSARLCGKALLALMVFFAWTADTALAADIWLGADCGLREAITAANRDEAVDGCAAGSGDDRIILSGDITQSDQPPPVTSAITVEGRGFAISGAQKHRLFFVAADGDLTLRDINLTSGQAREGSPWCVAERDWSADYGGAICNQGALTIIDSRIWRNAARFGGAVYAVAGSRMRVINSRFDANAASRSGGAICLDGDAQISRSSFSGNRADYGGALYISTSAKVDVSGSGFFGNSADPSGGAISSASREETTIRDSRFVGNTADNFGGALDNDRLARVTNSRFSANAAQRGGAIYNSTQHALVRVQGSSFAGNRGNSGGAISNDLGEAQITGSVFSGNRARFGGGALHSRSGSTLNVSGSYYTGNHGEWGGAVINHGEARIETSQFTENAANETGGAMQLNGAVTLEGLTIKYNQAASGGGIRIGYDADYIGAVSLRDSILAANQGGDCIVHADSALIESADSYIKDGVCQARWSMIAAGSADGYCPPRQLTDGVCAIGAPATAATAAPILVDERCSLHDAIRAANDDQATGGCKSGGGSDIIRFTGDIVMTADPPAITSPIKLDGGGYTISGQGLYRLFHVASGGDLTIRNAHLTRGRAHEGSPPCQAGDDDSRDQGGAICNHGRLHILDSRLSRHFAGLGGAIVNFGEAIIERSALDENLADYGAGLTNWGASSLAGSSFTGNSAAESGGAVYNAGGGAMVISNSRLDGNSARFGGGLFNSDVAIAIVRRSHFTGHLAEETGGALHIPFGSATISRVTIRDNHARESGGIHAGAGARLRLAESILADNDGGDCAVFVGGERGVIDANYIGDGSCGSRWYAGWALADNGYCPDARQRNGVCTIGAPDLGITQAGV